MQLFIVDSFTDVPFQGNPAAVCLPERELSPEVMQQIAAELNLSETAFVRFADAADTDTFPTIRYFSPKMEIPLCGHATLAAAKIMLQRKLRDTIRFVTGGGIEIDVGQSNGLLEMSFPVYETTPSVAPPSMLRALGIEQIANCEYNDETKILLLEIEDTVKLARLEPDFGALLASHDAINGVLVTAAADDGKFDFHSRYFWPWSGGNEDPVTGATHTFLAKYWSTRLHKIRMSSFQASHRTGWMEVALDRDLAVVQIRGKAVVVVSGEFCASPVCP